MLANGIVEYLNVVEHILSYLGGGSVVSPPYPIALEQVEEDLRNSVVEAIALPAHRVL